MATLPPPDAPIALEFVPFVPGPAAPPPPPVVRDLPPTLPGTLAPGQGLSLGACLSPAFYRSLFDVDTVDVTARLRLALSPQSTTPFLRALGDKPDLYGPLWLAATLVLFIGAGANLSTRLAFTATEEVPTWVHDFELQALAVGAVFGWALGAPLVLWLGLQYAGVGGLSLVQLACTVGYGMTPLLLSAVVCIVPSSALQWIAVMLGAVAAGLFTVKAIWPPVAASKSPLARGLLVATLAAHIGWGVVLKWWFFGTR